VVHWARTGRVSRVPLRARSRRACTSRRSGADARGIVALARATVNLVMSRFFAVVADGIPSGWWAISEAGRSVVVVAGRAVAGGRGTLVATLLKLAAFSVESVNLGIQSVNRVRRVSGGGDRRVRRRCRFDWHGRQRRAFRFNSKAF
jgi:hypothetical protein